MRKVPPPQTGKGRTSSSIGRPSLPKPPITQRAFTQQTQQQNTNQQSINNNESNISQNTNSLLNNNTAPIDQNQSFNINNAESQKITLQEDRIQNTKQIQTNDNIQNNQEPKIQIQPNPITKKIFPPTTQKNTKHMQNSKIPVPPRPKIPSIKYEQASNVQKQEEKVVIIEKQSYLINQVQKTNLEQGSIQQTRITTLSQQQQVLKVNSQNVESINNYNIQQTQTIVNNEIKAQQQILKQQSFQKKSVPPPAQKKQTGNKNSYGARTIPPKFVPKQRQTQINYVNSEQPQQLNNYNQATSQIQKPFVQNTEIDKQTIVGRKVNKQVQDNIIVQKTENNLQNQQHIQTIKQQTISPRKLNIPTPLVKKNVIVQQKRVQIKMPQKLIQTPDINEQQINVSNKLVQNKFSIQNKVQQLSGYPRDYVQEQGIMNNISVSQQNNNNNIQINQYNELQQKLRQIQLYRLRMDESSQQSYSNNNENIEQQEQQVSLDRSQQNIDQQQNLQQNKQKGSIYIIGQRNINNHDQLNNQLNNQINHNKHQQFIIGQTNYEEMEIQDQHQHQHQSYQNHNQHNYQSNLIYNQSISNYINPIQIMPPQQQHIIIPAPNDTIIQSNRSVQSTQHQYLPDQLSNSPSQSQNSMLNHHIIQTVNSNVQHPDKYHSQGQFLIQNNFTSDHININDHIKPSQKSDTQLIVSNNQAGKLQNHVKVHNQSLQMIHSDNGANRCIEQKNKQNYILNQRKSGTVLSHDKKIGASIQQMLKLFKDRRQEYMRNIQSIKKSEQLYRLQQQNTKNRIQFLLQQVNHKNLMILRHSNNFNDINMKNEIDRNIRNDNLKEVEQL